MRYSKNNVYIREETGRPPFWIFIVNLTKKHHSNVDEINASFQDPFARVSL